MTIMTRTNVDFLVQENYGLRPAAPSQVWDLEPAGAGATGTGVRTLAPEHRTLVRPGVAAIHGEPAAGRAFEPGRGDGRRGQGRREKRDNLALGAMMAAALLVGSIFGGAFSPAGTDAASQPAPSVQGAAVHYAR